MITPRGTFSIRMPAQMDIRGLEEWYRFNKAKNFTEFKAALNMMAIPGYNLVYADRYDTIYYLSNGRIPVRDPKYNWKTTLPGNTSSTLWNQLHPLADLPQVLQPSAGYVFNTNHSPFHSTAGADNPVIKDPTMGYETLENNRSLRFAELVAKLPKVSYEDFKKIKFDRQYPSTFAFPNQVDSLFLMDASQYPDIADLIGALQAWDKKSDVNSKGAAVFLSVYRTVNESPNHYRNYKVFTTAVCVSILRETKANLLRDFGKTDLVLGDIQKLVRGDVEIPCPGLPDVLAPMYSVPYKNGMVKGIQGDAYVELVRFTKEGPQIESMNVYGASARKDSPHYTDQMLPYTQQQTKKMSLKKEEVYKNAKRIYHPAL
jgi:acyl-homoserine-lactone acylase